MALAIVGPQIYYRGVNAPPRLYSISSVNQFALAHFAVVAVPSPDSTVITLPHGRFHLEGFRSAAAWIAVSSDIRAAYGLQIASDDTRVYTDLLSETLSFFLADKSPTTPIVFKLNLIVFLHFAQDRRQSIDRLAGLMTKNGIVMVPSMVDFAEYAVLIGLEGKISYPAIVAWISTPRVTDLHYSDQLRLIESGLHINPTAEFRSAVSPEFAILSYDPVLRDRFWFTPELGFPCIGWNEGWAGQTGDQIIVAKLLTILQPDEELDAFCCIVARPPLSSVVYVEGTATYGVKAFSTTWVIRYIIESMSYDDGANLVLMLCLQRVCYYVYTTMKAMKEKKVDYFEITLLNGVGLLPVGWESLSIPCWSRFHRLILNSEFYLPARPLGDSFVEFVRNVEATFVR